MRESVKVLLACAFALMLASCGGAGTSSKPDGGILPAAPGDPHATASPTAAPKSSPKPTSKPTSNPTAQPTPTPPPSPSASTRIPSTAGRIGLVQVFDYHSGYMPASQINGNAKKIDAVWASLEAGSWRSAHPGMLVSDYYIMGLDQNSVTHHGLSWWQQNHPDWILYACTASGAPTHDVAYMAGIGVPDVPIDIHNSDAVAFQVKTMSAAARSGGYNALAVDQVVFWNIYKGGNPNFGQSVKSGEYGCGAWKGGTFERHYASPSDPQYANDVVNYVAQARTVAHSYGLALITNHPAGSISNSLEQRLLRNTDVDMDETGFSDYGRYTSSNGGLFKGELAYLRYAQEHGTGMMVVDKFANEASVNSTGLEYSIASYMLANEGGLLLWVGGLNEYGTMQYHSEYGSPMGHACSAVTGGPDVYYRRFSGGLAVVNASASTQSFKLPSGSYRDIEGRSISSTLSIGPNGAYVLLGGSGC